MIGVWAIASGALEIASAIKLRKVLEHEWLLAIAGALSIAFGLLMSIALSPVAWPWSGGWAPMRPCSGVLMVVLGFRLRSLQRTIRGGGELPTEGLHQRV